MQKSLCQHSCFPLEYLLQVISQKQCIGGLTPGMSNAISQQIVRILRGG